MRSFTSPQRPGPVPVDFHQEEKNDLMSAVCGVVGRMASVVDAEQNLSAMLAPLEKRGPDGVSAYQNRAEGVVLGFRFLRSVPEEASPGILVNEDRTLFLVCDGQVFNDASLRPMLRGKGHHYSQQHS